MEYEPHMVALAWDPPVSMLVHRVHFDLRARKDEVDVSKVLTQWGAYQEGGLGIAHRPSAVEALLGILGGWADPSSAPSESDKDPPPGTAAGFLGTRAARRMIENGTWSISMSMDDFPTAHVASSAGAAELRLPTGAGGGAASLPARRPLLVDVGAGVGLFSLAASASGIPALAVEADPFFVDVLRQSAALNPELEMAVLESALGAASNSTCLPYVLGVDYRNADLRQYISDRATTSRYNAASVSYLSLDYRMCMMVSESLGVVLEDSRRERHLSQQKCPHVHGCCMLPHLYSLVAHKSLLSYDFRL